MKLIELDSSNYFRGFRLTEILKRHHDKTEIEHHCDAVVLSQDSDGFVVICAAACPESLTHTYLVRRSGFPDPVRIRLLEEGRHILVRGADFGLVYVGVYQ